MKDIVAYFKIITKTAEPQRLNVSMLRWIELKLFSKERNSKQITLKQTYIVMAFGFKEQLFKK